MYCIFLENNFSLLTCFCVQVQNDPDQNLNPSKKNWVLDPDSKYFISDPSLVESLPFSHTPFLISAGEERERSEMREKERGADLRGPGGLRAEAASGASHHAATGATELVVFAYPKRRKNRHPCSLRGAGRIGKGSPLSGLGAGFVAQSAAEVRWPTPAST